MANGSEEIESLSLSGGRHPGGSCGEIDVELFLASSKTEDKPSDFDSVELSVSTNEFDLSLFRDLFARFSPVQKLEGHVSGDVRAKVQLAQGEVDLVIEMYEVIS